MALLLRMRSIWRCFLPSIGWFDVFFVCMPLAFLFWMPLFSGAFHSPPVDYACSLVALLCLVALRKRYRQADFAIFALLSIVVFSLIHRNTNLLASIFYLVSVYIFVFVPRKFAFFFGFFVGIVGFHWISLSLRFFDVMILTPFTVIFIGVVFGISLKVLLFLEHVFFRVIALVGLCFLRPLGFSWLNVVYFSSYTVFSPTFFALICIVISMYCITSTGRLRFLGPVFFLLSFDYNFFVTENAISNAVYLHDSYVPQDAKWDHDNLPGILDDNFTAISDAISQRKKLVLLPETAFPLHLNSELAHYDRLKNLSRDITIVAGALRKDDTGKVYNTNFVFDSGEVTLVDKIDMVPFGEVLPFPFLDSLLGSLQFDLLYSGDGYSSFYDSRLGVNFNNAICYEMTLPGAYSHNLQKSSLFDYLEFGIVRSREPRYVLANSNNAWFAPSIHSLLQRMITKYYARHYGYFVFHSSNMTPGYIVSPNNGFDS